VKTPDATAWLAARGWAPFPFQREVWDAMARGESGLLHATTGAGKTYAVWLGALQALQVLRLSAFGEEEQLPGLGNLTALQKLCLSSCPTWSSCRGWAT
jgi:superfamily II DNA/RNA helicase